MKRDPHIDFYNDWKMITIIIGHNDACTHACNATLGVDAFEDASPGQYIRNIQRALDVLHRHLPRTFVNLVPVADVTIVLDLLDKPKLCYPLHWYFCPCLFDPEFTDGTLTRKEMKSVLSEYKSGLLRLLASGRYDTNPQFTVVLQVKRTAPSARRCHAVYFAAVPSERPDALPVQPALPAAAARPLLPRTGLLPLLAETTQSCGKVPLEQPATAG